MNPEDPIARDADERLAEWLEAVDSVPEGGFTPVDDFEEIPGQARADSWFWCSSVFSKEVCPHNDTVGARHAFHLATEHTPDLLRHELAVHGLDLVVTESRNFVLVQVPRESVDVLRLPPADRAEAVRRLAERIFDDRHGRHDQHDRRETIALLADSPDAPAGTRCPPLRIPSDIEDGSAFSSNQAADPELIACWRDRVECGVRRGAVYFLCYKKPSQLAGYANARQWFDEDFRTHTR